MTAETLLGTVVRTGDTAEVIFDRTYETDAADLWHAVTDSERLGRWFAPVEGDLRLGGRFTIHFDDSDLAGCRVTACDPQRSYSWEWPQNSYTSLVTVAVESAAAGSRLVLTHTRLPATEAPGYAAGWDVFVHRLDEHLAGREVQDTWFADWSPVRDRYAARLAEGC